MITLFIFYLHTITAAALFTRRWQEQEWKEGLVAVGFLLLIFSVGWPMATIILKIFLEPQGFAPWLDRDTLSLVMLTLLEVSGYLVYVRKTRHKTLAREKASRPEITRP